ncbi:MAG: CDP-diacylglycerol--glycerol-3-phosphate 3-phosphatidyltransferase [Saccharofermentans sp.]|nr:CDP-diacylglycerol--glycerol-3-phosphate 3-phosphatidyltransferase [Clostridiales bacterium]MCR5049047.1 CDP-diacylglycerol--glycerol-3-phosphate 3-phosphatidyltransferase [Saccharofermentans sp.]
MNLPNKLSLLRIILIPVTMLFMLPISIYGFEPEGWNSFINEYGMMIAGLVFIIASLTDFFDGQIARRCNLITDLGKFLDSLADKMLVIAVLIAFVATGRISPWLLAIIVLREFMVTGIRLVASKEGVVMAAKMIGKIKTTTQMIAIIYLMFEPLLMKFTGDDYQASLQTPCAVSVIGDILFYICVIMTIVSGMDYLIKNKGYLKENPAS